MSVCDLDDEVIQEWLAEGREHLVTIESDLLSMEQSGAAIDEKLVNRVFRAAHSIKGGAGFFDLVKIKELAHKTENVLDLVRERQLIPDSKVINILLLAFDKLKDLILDYRESNNADIGEFTAALTDLTRIQSGGSEEAAAPASDTVTLTDPHSGRKIQVPAFDLAQARRTGKAINLVKLDLLHDFQQKGKTPVEVFNLLINCGTILDTNFDLASAGTLDDEPSNKLLLDILYATPLDAYSISQVLDIDLEQVRVIEDRQATAPSSSSPAVTAAEPANAEAAKAANPIEEVQPAPAAPPASAPAPAETSEVATKTATAPAPGAHVESTVRLNVALLDTIMNLAGELVLSRNQINDAIANWNESGIRTTSHRLSLVTSELQEAISLTRMQPVGGLFAKFSRLVRDLAGELGKEVQLKTDGGDVELDKTILEGLSDPLTHMVRNSVDHGIETPSTRLACGKPALGTVTLRARHQAGQVLIEIADDGKGLSGDKIAASSVAKGIVSAEMVQGMSEYEKLLLIFMPGVSTAERLTSVSGRGVGMDVVKTNLDKLGGKIEIQSVVGRGTSFQIKLPLTLAIIPSLLVSDHGQRFAIPQVSISELIRLPAAQIAERVDRAGEAEVIRVRDRLVPLVHLADVLGTPRDKGATKCLNVVLVDTGAFEYGLAVELLHDTVEIVVKPLGRHLQKLTEYAGATILGDGEVAAILDVAGLATRAGLYRSGVAGAAASTQKAAEETVAGEMRSLLLFENAPGEHCALPIEVITRVERISADQVEHLSGRRTMQSEGSSLPLITLHDVAAVGELETSQRWVVIVFERFDRAMGLLVAEPLDMVEAKVTLDRTTFQQPGIAGSMVLDNRTTLMLDLFGLAEAAWKHWPGMEQIETPTPVPAAAGRSTVLVAEDSDFFREQIKRMIEAVGYKVLAAEDGQEAWELLEHHPREVAVVTTDVEMPRLDGLGLAKRMRADSRFSQIPVIALSALAGEDEVARGLEAGISEYQVKLDQDQLLGSIRRAVEGPAGAMRN